MRINEEKQVLDEGGLVVRNKCLNNNATDKNIR